MVSIVKQIPIAAMLTRLPDMVVTTRPTLQNNLGYQITQLTTKY